MTKRFMATALMAGVFASGTAFAGGANPYDKIGPDNPAFSASGMGSIQNDNNTALRFGAGGRVAIPGNAGDHANENSAVSDYDVGGSGAIVAPRGRN